MMQKVMHTLKPITLRNVPPAVARVVNERAARDGVSLNKAVIRLLEEALGVTSAARVHHDLDAFIGVWSESEARRIERAVAEGRRVEPEMWR
jgi:hypothetical protein